MAPDGRTDIEVLHRLGPVCQECVSRGEWWRLLTFSSAVASRGRPTDRPPD